jgi:hypothetical protein
MANDDKTKEMERRLEALERSASRGGRGSGMEAAFWALIHNLFPEEARTHMRAAGREQLLAARAYLDHWIARLDKTEQQSGTRHESIEIN